MTVRAFKLLLEMHPDRVYYSLEYDPPVKNCGGYLGSVYEGGGLFSMPYASLRALGDGVHSVEVDEHVQSERGAEPGYSDTQKLVNSASIALFMERAGGCNGGTTFCTILKTFTPQTGAAIYPLLDQGHREELARYARSIPRFRWERRFRKFEIFHSSGSSELIPDENLVAIRKFFL